ncbi:DNA cytosine methyltransferase [Rhodomicrobium sp. Az07]|uniref:DNA cytosine methyltransferase n=1 Tax=Rhodomicrobium sp. Az07 TaxID=2839034 RepID=UPI001BEB6F8C|nr:DNA cytosine methyltransferase [Rhodomicrobium sp. Az07]MBT3069460.1 DNA cytosine methyltransferase [Rhodomicrobium sp. Az07]
MLSVSAKRQDFVDLNGRMESGEAWDFRRIAVSEDLFQLPFRSGGKTPVVSDLFAGAGGFSLGFEAAGFKIKTAIEIDAWACDTLRENHRNSHVIQADLTRLSDNELKHACEGSNVIVGGPPCQGFSIANMKAGDPKDPRNSLFREFVRAVDLVKPEAVLLENVPGLLGRKAQCKRPVIEIIASELESLGYVVAWRVIEAQSYGVPQIRPRLVVAGTKSRAWTFPAPTHGVPLDPHPNLFGSADDLIPYVTTWEAISDLPNVNAREGAEYLSHEAPATNEYQRMLRAGRSETFNHMAMKHSARLVERFSHVKCGQSGMHAPDEHQARKRGDYSAISGKVYSQNNRRMHPDRPCHTIPASFYANFIHPFQHRNFTPREGARLQSFPDWYKFMGKPTVVSTKLLAREKREEELHLCQYNQIGNAVPPLLAYNLAMQLRNYLR